MFFHIKKLMSRDVVEECQLALTALADTMASVLGGTADGRTVADATRRLEECLASLEEMASLGLGASSKNIALEYAERRGEVLAIAAREFR